MWRHRIYRICLLGMMCLVLAGLEMTTGLVPAVYASGPGGNVSDPVVRAVDIAEPAVVRIITSAIAQLTVNFGNGTVVTFPTTAQNGVNGYAFSVSGSGAFISAHGDILTADHVVSPTPDIAQQLASQDVATFINQHQNAQQVTATQVDNELLAGQLASTSRYTQVQSTALVSTAFSGPLSATSFNNLPATQGAPIDRIVKQTSFTTTDTAIVHVNGFDNMPMLQLGDASMVQPQDQLTIIGFPGNGDVNTDPTTLLTLSINQIFVSAIKPNGGSSVIQVGGNVEHGDSGGPALDSTGQVVGIVSFGLVTGQAGETSFLQTTTTARQLIQQAGINTTPSAFQKAWNQAFTDYASTTPGHWHAAAQELQQLASQYPLFKAIKPFLQYAQQQAQNESTTQLPNTGNPVTSSISGLTNPMVLLPGGLIVLIIIVLWISIAVGRSRRRKRALANTMMPPASPGASYFGATNQSYGALPLNASSSVQAPSIHGAFPPAPVPQTPPYPAQAGYPPAGQIRPQAPVPQTPPYPTQASYPPQAFRQQMSGAQPAVRPQAPGSMAAFGAPPASMPNTPQPSNSTIVARSGSSVSQWRIWPCGHTNRFDAAFCGTCGESAPPAPLVRRMEQ